MNALNAKQHVSFEVTSTCLYFRLGRESKFYAVCQCEKGMHSVVDLSTKRPVPFEDRRAVDRLCRKLNNLIAS